MDFLDKNCEQTLFDFLEELAFRSYQANSGFPVPLRPTEEGKIELFPADSMFRMPSSASDGSLEFEREPQRENESGL